MHRPREHLQPDWYDYGMVWLYQFALWVFVVIILLNVVFGIIIDTFGELRADKAMKRSHMENTCFICGIDRFTFDHKGAGFEACPRRHRHRRGRASPWADLVLRPSLPLLMVARRVSAARGGAGAHS